jgi:hypothetical protein
VLRQCDQIRLHDSPGVLLHFKFIKPDLTGFIQTRIQNNEDWDDSAEYKAYQAVLKNSTAFSFLDEKYSRKLNSEKKLDEFFYTLSSRKQTD